METNIDPKVTNIIKALAYTENGGKPDVSNLKAGKSGETKSMLQFLPATWKEYSKQITGEDNLPITPENESVVTYGKVSDWLKNGYTPEQIFSIWNSGRPNAYKKNVKGTNSSGVAYDTPAYVAKATNYFNQFQNNEVIGTSQTGTQNKNPDLKGNQVAINNQSSGLIPEQQPPQTGLLPPQVKQAPKARMA